MEASAPASTKASGDALPVSPPPMDEGDPVPLAALDELFTAVSGDAVASSQATVQTSTDTLPSASPPRVTTTSIPQSRQQEQTNTHDQPTTPETASSERSTSDGVPTPTESEKAGQNAQINGNRDQNGVPPVANGLNQTTGQQMRVHSGAEQTENGTSNVAGQLPDHNKGKKWFEVLPIVLENFKRHDREQIRQLMVPRCEACERNKIDKKAEVTCSEDGCILKDGPLCWSCWKLTHKGQGERHRRRSASTCQQCQLTHVAYWCAECDLKFCIECFEQIHSVHKVKGHPKLATEDAPGTCLAKSHWSSNFRNVIIQMIKARKRPPPASGESSGGTVGGKRKRDVEVIVIDDDEEDGVEMAMNNVQVGSSLPNGISEQPTRANGIQQNGSVASTSVYSQTSVAQNSMMNPIPFPQDIGSAPLTSSAYNTSSMPNGTDTNSSIGNSQWNTSASQFGASSSMGNRSNSMNFANNGMMQVAPSSIPNSVNVTSGVWSTTSAISTDLASTSSTNNLLPFGGAVFAENALVDSLVDRYHEVNQNVTMLEMQSEHLTKQIAVVTCQGPYAAGPIMTMLSKLQPLLEAAKKRRDKLLIAMIIQSNDIMASVRLLRLTELGNVPQVPMISHRKCLQISNEINEHKKKLIDLNQTLSETLTQSTAVNASWENTLIRNTSANIQMHEESIKKLKKNREVEIVRIVQFSHYIRESLKRAFQQNQEVQRQQRQQPQQFL